MSYLAGHMILDPVALQRTMDAVGRLTEHDVTALTLDELRAIFSASHDLSRHVFGEEWRRTHAPRRTRAHRKLMRKRYYRRRWCRDSWSAPSDRWNAMPPPNGGMWTVAMARWARRSA